MSRDPLVGNIFENLIVIEALKGRYNQGHNADLYFFRDSNGVEIDLLCKTTQGLVGIEVKSSSTWHAKFAKGLLTFSKSNSQLSRSIVAYNGKSIDLSSGVEVVEYNNLSILLNLGSMGSGLVCHEQIRKDLEL